MKTGCLLLCLASFSGALSAGPTDPCAALEGAGLAQCRSNQETLRQQARLEQRLREQEDRQIQLDKQQRDVQQQLDSMRLQNESLRQQLQRELATQPSRPAARDSADPERSREIASWKTDNPWFGSNYAKTQFAMRYARQLERERPDLTGRPLLDALSTKVVETFGDGR